MTAWPRPRVRARLAGAAVLAAGCVLLGGARCYAAPRFRVGAELGYAFPTGALERGSRVSDVSFGVPQLQLDLVYQLAPAWSAGIATGAGLVLPTLCSSSSECISSLGQMWSLAVTGGWQGRVFARAHAAVDGQLGYQWLVTRFSSDGADAERIYRGWFFALHGALLFELSNHVALGPALSVAAMRVEHVTLEEFRIRASRPAGGAVRIWPSAGVRVCVVP